MKRSDPGITRYGGIVTFKNPKTISVSALAIDALRMMEEYNISQLIAVNEGSYIGIIHMHDILKEGIA